MASARVEGAILPLPPNDGVHSRGTARRTAIRLAEGAMPNRQPRWESVVPTIDLGHDLFTVGLVVKVHPFHHVEVHPALLEGQQAGAVKEALVRLGRDRAGGHD